MDNNKPDESYVKTDELFTTSASDKNGQGNSVVHKNSKGALVLNIFGAASAMIGAGAVTAIFTGRLSVPGSSEIIYLERIEAIIASAVCLGSALSLHFLSRWIRNAEKRAEAVALKATLVPTEHYNAVRRKYTAFRIVHYTILVSLLITPVIGTVTEGSVIGDIFIGIFMLSLTAFIPILILLLLTKRKLKKIKSAQGHSASEGGVNG